MQQLKAVDLFAGWGGFSLGAHLANVHVVFAANHWKLAVDAHQANHPRAVHACQDLRQCDWAGLPEYDVLLAAPACQGHSQAAQPQRARMGAGFRRRHDALRATAWAVLDCAEVTRPRAFVVENVTDFRKWAMFDLWCEGFARLGYTLQHHEVIASDFGVPQLRRRLFITGTLNGESVDITPTTPGARPAMEPIVDWDAGDWRPIASATGNARKRLDAARRFGRAWVQHVTHHRGLPVSEPLRTITTADQIAVVDGDYYRPLTVAETARGMGFPSYYRWPEGVRRRDAIKGLGNAVCPPKARAVCAAVARALEGPGYRTLGMPEMPPLRPAA